MRRLLETVLGIVMLSAAAQAAGPSLHNYMVVFHHTGLAFDRPVDAVYAHTGVVMQDPDRLGGGSYWVDVRHVPMTRQGDHFFARQKLQAWSQPGGATPRGVAVQYWVHFQDGSLQRSRDLPVSLDRHVYRSWGPSYSGALAGAQHEFERRQDAARTGGTEITVTPDS